MIAMLARVDIEHKVDQRTFESSTGAIQDRKTGRSNPGSSFQIQNAQCCAQIDVVFRFKIKCRRIAPAPDFHVVRFLFANWDAFVGDIGKG